jgi:NAD(P) transhydrogenase subunit beta
VEAVLISLAYLAASILFILSLKGLSSQETARAGNLYGVAGMFIAIAATLTATDIGSLTPVITALVIGGVVGTVLAVRVQMTAMPELVALLHSFVGLAAVLVGFASYLGATVTHGGVDMLGGASPDDGRLIHLIEVFLAVAIGALTFTGSVMAFLKLKGSISGKSILLPARHLLNLGLILLSVWLCMGFVDEPGTDGLWQLLVGAILAGALGVHMVAAIGGADMPVVVSLLNSYSGWTASAAGFMLGNDLLIVTGALVGSSGAILSLIMCRAMNRSLISVIAGGFGSSGGGKAAAVPAGDQVAQDVNEITVAGTVEELKDAKSVVIVPGYGLAVARAQHAVREFTEIMRKRGARVRFAVHPVAGRLPGHMNVLLAEANVPYDIVLEMDEINDDFPRTDIVLVIGANDIVNPGAQDDTSSPIYGMPVLEVWKAAKVVVSKRSRAVGYAGVDNPLFYRDNTSMLFGDARDSMEAVVSQLR